MSKKIIAISGTHGTGKTTVAYSLCSIMKKKGHNVVVMDELAREAPFDINRAAGDKTQIWLCCKQITKELEYSEHYEYIITDRSVLDAYAYGLTLTKNDWIFKHLENYLVAHIKTYYKSLFLLDPSAFTFNVEDGVRDTDPDFRLMVHNTLEDLFKKHNIEYHHTFNTVDVFLNFI
jgi:thymidylate kinase